MSMIRRKPTWTKQPQIAAGIDWANPLTQGLRVAAAVQGGVLREWVTGGGPTFNSGSVKATATGLSSHFDFHQAQFAHNPLFDVLEDITVFSVVTPSTLADYGHIISKNAANNTNLPYELRLGVGYSEANLCFVRANASGPSVWKAGSANLVAPGQRTAIAVTQSAAIGVTPTFYTNGVAYVGQPEFVTAGGSATSSNGPLYLGNRGDDMTPLHGTVEIVLVFARVLSAAEIQSLTINPWQLFAPQARTYAYSGLAEPSSSSRLVIKRSVPWNRQPPSRTPVGRSGLAARVHWCAIPSGQTVDGSAQTRTASLVAAARGIATNGGNSGYVGTKPAAALLGAQAGASAGNSDLSFVFVGNTPSGESSVIYDGQSDGSMWSIYKDGSGNLRVSDDVNTLLFSGVVWPASANVTCISGGRSGTEVAKVWFDGELTLGSSGAAQYFNTPAFSAGFGSSAYPDANRFRGTGYALFVLRGLLSDAEAKSLTNNPWQLFAPSTQLISIQAELPAEGVVIPGFPLLSQATFTPGSITNTTFRPRVTASPAAS